MTKSHFRGHEILWKDNRWIYADTLEPIPGYGGDPRPCKKCGQSSWSGDGDVDRCIGVLPGVSNACCGHGVREDSYIVFRSGVVVRGFCLDALDVND